MDEEFAEASDASTIVPETHSTTAKETIPSPCVCVVCGDAARYSYYGAIVCQPCRIFFRRNVENPSALRKCDSGDNCQINVNTRRICPSCRIGKCFASGMSIEMIRATRTKQPSTTPKENPQMDSTPTASARVDRGNEPALIRTLNLLQADQSTLSVDQWNHLSNLVHCFDEYSGFGLIQHFIDEQSSLPPKFRFKHQSVNTFFTSMMSNVQLVVEKNRDFLSLRMDDRITLLRSTVEYTTNIGAAFALREGQLLDRSDFFRSTELIFRPSAVALTKRLIDQLDPDMMFLKVMLSIVAFFTSNYTVYPSTPTTHLKDMKEILRIQDAYTELVWRYLLYKHNYRDAVLCFSNLIRCLLLAHNSVAEAHDAPEVSDIIHSVVHLSEERLSLNE